MLKKEARTMPEYLDTPDFKSEQEEADWWDSPAGRAATLQAFQKAQREGTLGRGTLAERMGLQPTATLRLDPQDARLAKEQAHKQGIEYRTYLEIVLHEALQHRAIS
jgi:hypothetical protein